MGAPENSGENNEPRQGTVLEEQLARSAQIHVAIARHDILPGQVFPYFGGHSGYFLPPTP